VAKPQIFISMGTPYSAQYRDFRNELERIIRENCNAEPKIIGKNEYPTGSPLLKIMEVMSDCDGIVVVAYERKFITSGFEKRNSPNRTEITNSSYTTAWNHIESAIAFTMGIPIYIICERGLTEEGLIETKIDWYVQYIDFNIHDLRSLDVVKSIQEWVDSTRNRKNKKTSLLKIIAGDVAISQLTPNEIIKSLGIIIASFTAGGVFTSCMSSIFSSNINKIIILMNELRRYIIE